MLKAIVREMPDGSARRVYPFHISLEGLEKAIICRDDQDYDVLVKYIFLCALSKNVRVVTYVVVSNHLHVIVLAEDLEQAKACGDEKPSSLAHSLSGATVWGFMLIFNSD